MRQFLQLQDKPRKIDDIVRDVGISRRTYFRWKTLAEEGGIDLPDLPKQLRVQPLRTDVRNDDLKSYEVFLEIPFIKEYTLYCEINQSTSFVSNVFKLCNFSDIMPGEYFESLDSVKTNFLKFDQMMKAKEYTTESYRKAIRKVLTFKGITIPARDKILGGGTDSKGDYARVYLSLPELDAVAKIVGESAGSEYHDLFLIHHEIFPRPSTMLNWIPSLDVKHADVDGDTYEFGECSVFEKKQNKHYDKILLEPRALKLVSDYSGKRIVEDGFDLYEKKYAKALRQGYQEIGKIQDGMEYKKGMEGWLYYNRPIYSIRHSSAITWLYRTSFDASMVSRMGWEKVDTLSQFYARSTATNMMQKGVCYYCNPPNVKSSLPLFCSPLHSLAWYNNGRVSR